MMQIEYPKIRLKFNATVIFIIAFLNIKLISAVLNISNDPDVISTLPSIAVDSEGHVHVAFWGTYDSTGAPDGVTTDVFYLNNKSGDFGAPVKIKVPSGFGYYSKDLTLAVDNEGYAHIAFRRSADQIWDELFDDIFYATNKNSDITNATLLIDGGHGGGFASAGPRRPSIAVDDSGNVHLIYLGKAGTHIYYMKKNDISFTTPIEVPEGRVWSVNPPSLAVDKQGSIHITFKGYSATDPWGDIFYISNSSGQFISQKIPSNLGIEHEPTITVDSNNNPHIVFNRYNTIYYTKNTGSGFLPIQVIGSGDIQAADPFIITDLNDCIHVLCKNDNYITNVSGEFESYDIVSQYSPVTTGKHKIGISSDNKIHFVFHYTTGGYNYDIYYTNFSFVTSTPTISSNAIPLKYALIGNYPNPFNPITTIAYQLPKMSNVSIKIYNSIGQLVKTLINQRQPANYYTIKWDGKDDLGRDLASGVYIYQLITDDFRMSRKMILIR